MTDATETQDQPSAPDFSQEDAKLDAIGAVVVVCGLVAIFIFGIWSSGLN